MKFGFLSGMLFCMARLDAMQRIGIDTEFHVYPGLGHGFGLGTGTSAEGWLDDTVAFWEKQMK